MIRSSELILLLAGGVMGASTLMPELPTLSPESADVVTVAGNGEQGVDDGQGEMAQFNWPTGVAIAPDWTLSITDYANHLIRTISPDGVVTTLAGNGVPGSADGQGTAAQFKGPDGLVISPSGDRYIAEADNYQIRKITRDGTVTTVAGSGRRGDRNGPAREAQFGYPTGIAIDGRGVLYIADRGAHKIKMITPDGVVSTLAGSGVPGYTDGMGRAAQFHDPMTVVVDRAGRLFVSDSGSHTIRMILPTGRVTTVAGAPQSGFADGRRETARFNWPTGLALDETGNLYVADSNNARIRKITPDGIVTTIAGNGRAGFHDGPGLTAQFNFPTGVGVDRRGNLYVADSANHRIRRISAGPVLFTACCRQDLHIQTLPPEAGLHDRGRAYYTESLLGRR